MKTSEPRFSIPFAVFADRLPPYAHIVLTFLFSQSDIPGHCVVKYEEIMQACDIGSRNTVSKYLTFLARRGWITRRMKLPEAVALTLSIPTRLRTKWPTGVLSSDIIKMPKQA